MIIKPFLSRRSGNVLVAKPDPDGNITVVRMRTKVGAKNSASRTGGVVGDSVLTAAPIIKRGLRIEK